MAIAKNKKLNNQKNCLVICGQGRIGGTLGERLKKLKIDFFNAHIDAQEGLKLTEGFSPKNIQLLIICISARQKSANPQPWQWKDIFTGLVKQIKANYIQINNIVFVSSTRVYEGVEQGMVTATTNPVAKSVNGQALIVAENLLIESAVNLLILRCSGLYGELYPVYTPILKTGKDKPRFGIDANTVVEELLLIVKVAQKCDIKSGIKLLTDGGIYWSGKRYTLENDHDEVNRLAEFYRILLNSADLNY